MSPEIDATMRSSGPGRSEPSMQSLVEQADGLGRAAVMKDVVGPALDEVMRPIYATNFDANERSVLGKTQLITLSSLERFTSDAKSVLASRFEHLSESGHYQEICDLNDNRDDLFFHHNAISSLFSEGIESGVIIPLTVASHIYQLEKNTPIKYGHAGDEVLSLDHLIKIMERESFDDIILHLTKGPNGFLGITSAQPRIENTGFFDFPSSWATDAYDIRDGEVIGLSDAYHIQANKRRRELQELHKASSEEVYKGTTDSSGCPMRHSFPDPETGESQEPLVVIAKNFLVAALKVNQQEQEAA